MARDKSEEVLSRDKAKPGKVKDLKKQDAILQSLRLTRRETNSLVSRLIPISVESVTYVNNKGYSMNVSIIPLDNDCYFAKLDSTPLSKVENKKLFIKEAVLFALKEKNISRNFEEIGVGGVVADEGRLGFLSHFRGQIPPSVHAYTVFKLPGENDLYIEDPRTEIFSLVAKLQSRMNDQICCFAATASFYFCYKAFADYKISLHSTKSMFEEIYECSELKRIMVVLEDKVGKSIETKQEVIDSFVQEILSFKNPVKDLSTIDAFAPGV